jgi:alkylation response protein AidB-like acyl-CoA dehydrogenase
VDFAPDGRLEEFRERTRALVRRVVTPEMVDRAHATGTMHDWDLHREIARAGFLAEGMASATRSGRDPLEMFVLFDELGLANAPYYGLGTTMLVAGVLDEVGSEFHRREVLPRIQEGDAIVALGYTEPDAGSDVAAAITKADRSDDPSGEWIISGQKMFTTLAHEASFVFLLTRTNPAVAKHLGLTMFVVPLDLPGIEVQPVYTLGGDRTNITFFNGVRVGDEWRVGEVDGGWDVMKIALAYERGVFGNTNQAMSLLERCRDWAAGATRPDGTRFIDDPTVRLRLARIAIENEVGALLTLRAAFVASKGRHPTIEGAVAKLFATEAYNRAAEACLAIGGPHGLLQRHEDGAASDGWIDWAARDAPVTTIYGGTSEIQRNLIAERHLGLPKTR